MKLVKHDRDQTRCKRQEMRELSMSKLDLVIRGGTVVTGTDEYAADVGI